MKRYFILILLFYISISATAQNINRKYENYKTENGITQISVSDGKYIFKYYSGSIVETSFIPKGEVITANSHTVELLAKPHLSKVTENKDAVIIATSGMMITIQKAPFHISYSYKNKILLSEKNGYIKKDSTEMLDFNLDNSESLYGGGARAVGMNRRGKRLQLYNRAHYGYENYSELMNFTMPVVISSKMYAVHFDNAPVGYLDLDSKKNNTLAYETISGRKTYQIIAGDSWKDLMANYTYLTGRQPIPPRWVFGNFASRFGYHSQAEAEKTVRKFREDNIPLDAIIFDLYWFGKDIKGTMGNLEIFRDSFPDFEKMVEDLKEKNIKTILITEPFVLTTSKRWQEAVDKKILATDQNGNPFKYDFYFGNTGLIDIFNSKAKDWFWNIYKDLINKGIAGWWGDLGEPEVHPSGLFHATGSADEVHNIYGHNWAKLIYDGYHKDFPNQRPFILMRSGYSGSQRFGMVPWSGDVNRSWGGLKSQTEISLQMGMQGMAYMHSDLGGFAGANLDNELYVRWLQYGVFQPVFRPHAQEEVPAEPVFREAKTKALAKKAIELRYRMLAYNYTLAFDNNQNGMPFMRPLLFEEPQNEKVYGISDSYLWGNEFLVAPVTEAGQNEKEIYFPDTSNWFDFYSGQKHNHGSTEKIVLSENHIPVFVRAGAFVPLVSLVQNTKDYSTKNIELHYFYDETVKENNGHLYNDDGETPEAFEKGRYEILHFESKTGSDKLNISIHTEKGNLMRELDRTIQLVVHNIAHKPGKVTINGKKIRSKWVREQHTLTMSFKYQHNKSKNIMIQLSK